MVSFWKTLYCRYYLLSRYIGLFLSYVLGFVKSVMMVLKSETIERIKADLQDDRYQPEAIGKFQPERMMRESREYCKKFVIALLIFYYMVPLTAFMTAWYNLNVHQTEEYFSENITCFDFQTYYHAIPFETPTKTRCELDFIFMFTAMNIFFAFIGGR